MALATANALLASIGVSVRVLHLRECVSSLFVALLEGLLKMRLERVKRHAESRNDKIENVKLVIEALEGQVLKHRVSLAHISPSRIVDGNEDDISNLLLLLGDLESALSAAPSTKSTASTSHANSEHKRTRAETPTSPKKRKPVVAFSPTKSTREYSLPSTIYSGSLRPSDSRSSSPLRKPPTALVARTAFQQRHPVASGSKQDQSVRGKEKLKVVEDVEEYLMSRAKREMDRGVEEGVGRVRQHRGGDEMGSGVSGIRNPGQRNTTTRFNLKSTATTPHKPPHSSALQIRASDTPHTRALKLRQQRLISAREDALARTHSAAGWVSRSLGATERATEAVRREVRDEVKRKQVSVRGVEEVGVGEAKRWWEGTGVFGVGGVDGSDGEEEHEEGSVDREDGGFEKDEPSLMEQHLELDDASSILTEFSMPSGFEKFRPVVGGEVDSDSDSFIRGLKVWQQESRRGSDVGGGGPSGIQNRDELDSFHENANESFRSADIDRDENEDDLPSEIEPNSESFDFSDRLTGSYESFHQRNDNENSENESVADRPISIAEHNFIKFGDLVKRELGIKQIPEGTKSRTWNGQLRDRKRALEARMYQRKRNLHNEMTTFSDMRPLQVLRRDVERTAKATRAIRDRDAQRKAKSSLVEQKRRVIRMEQRVVEAEEEVERILTKRKMREEELARHLYDTYLSSQRDLIRETSRFERDKRKAREEAERMHRESKESFARDQIRLLEEELRRAKWEEEVVSKAHAEEMRKLVREQKVLAKESIQKIKNKLVVDENDFELQRAAATNVMQKMKFKVV
ncbi:hypothetical protein HDU98_003292 [Podochytrium sp. JEL0797]|nr:hypothetical protein HDU98_003292 [Podochytrium sp. JEL0797]